MTSRVLAPHDWHRIPDDAELSSIVGLLRPGIDEVHVVEDEDGRIVGCWSLIQSLHAEGVWIDDAHRGKAGVSRRLLRFLQDRAKAHGATRIFTSASTDEIRSLAARIGEKFPDSYVIGVE